MEETVIIMGMDGLPIELTEEEVDFIIKEGPSKILKKKYEESKKAETERSIRNAQRRMRAREKSIERRRKKDFIDVTHPYKRKFFKIEEKKVENPEGFKLKKVTNRYDERRPTKRNR